jgi:hypothetical protein
VSPRLAALVGLLLAAAGVPAARAEPAGPPPPPVALEVSVVGTPDDLRIVRELLERRLPSAGRTTWSRADSLDPADVLRAQGPGVIRCWIDLRDPRRARLAFAAWSGERFLVRDVDLHGKLDPLDRAALAEVLDSSLEALVENERAGLTRREAEALLAPQAAAPPLAPAGPMVVPAAAPRSPLLDAPAPVRERTHVEAGAFYAMQALADRWPAAHGPGVSLALAGELPRELGHPRWFAAGWLSAQYRLPVSASGAEAGVGLDGFALRAGGDVGGERFGARLGAGVDLVHVTPEVADPAVTSAASRWTAGFALTAALRGQLYRFRGLRVVGSLLVDVVPTAVDYGVSAGGTLVPTFSPWRLRPGIGLEATLR